jgi:DNA repair exonuclease SbcCD ATPase subunit
MKIKQLQIKNFLSVQKAHINFDEFDGLTVIKGKNLDTGGSNGAGKSTIVEAVYFALTGKTLRKSTEASLVNSQAKKGLEVAVQFEKSDGTEVWVSRSKKPTKMQITIDGQDVTAGHRDGSQARLDEIIGAPHKVLAASMFFGQSNDLNFLDASPTVKREIIRNFLNLDDLFSMRDSIRDFKSNYNSEIKQCDTLINECIKDIESIQSKIDKVNTVVDVTVEQAEAAWEVYNKLFSEYNKLEGEVNQLITKINADKARVEDPTCPTCKQRVSVESVIKNIGEMSERLSRKEKDFKNLTQPIPPHHTVDYVKACTQNVDVLRGLKTEKLDRIEETQKWKSKCQLDYEVMRFWEKALSEKGVIKYVIRNILSYFNERINYYLSYLTDHTFSLEFDDELSEIITISSNITHYISLSGGERRKINLAVMMALKDLLLLSDTDHPDLLFFDEVAENIDEQGIQGLYNLLLDLKKTRQIFVITHNKNLKTLLDSSKRLTVEKKKGISYIWHK